MSSNNEQNNANEQITISRYALWTTFIAACASQVAQITITITLAVECAPPEDSVYRIALAAAFADILALPALIAVFFLPLRDLGLKLRLLLGTTSVVLAILATVLTMYTLLWIWNNVPLELHGDDFKARESLTEGGFGVWAVAIVSQTFLYSTVLWPRGEHRELLPTLERAGGNTCARFPNRSKRMRPDLMPPPTATADPRSEFAHLSSAFSDYSLPLGLSLRKYISKALRPVTSKAELLFHNSPSPPDGNSLRSGRIADVDLSERNDGFQDWDTSGVSPTNDEPFYINSPSRQHLPRNRLEIDPFNRSLLDEGVHSPFLVSPTSSLETATPARSRQHSITDQSHIHPLFRSESPVPLPLASPDTAITASPYAGQVVSPEHQAISPRKARSTPNSRHGSLRRKKSIPVDHPSGDLPSLEGLNISRVRQ